MRRVFHAFNDEAARATRAGLDERETWSTGGGREISSMGIEGTEVSSANGGGGPSLVVEEVRGMATS